MIEQQIVYNPGPVAIKFHLSPARVKVAWGPVRSGKSTALVWRAFYKAQEAAAKGIAMKGVILRDTYRNLEDTTVKTLTEWLGPLGVLRRRQSVSDFVFKVGGIQHELLLRHGQTAADASSFLSSEYAFIGLEEVAPAFTPSGVVSPGIAEEVFDIALTRLVQRGIDNPELAITCNPPTPNHWVNKRIISKDREELRKLGWWPFFFDTHENEQNLRPGYYDELRRSLQGKDHLIKRFVEGEIVAIYPGMPVFSGDFNQRIHLRDDLKPIKGKPFILGWDFGLTPSCVWTQIDNNGRWLVFYELQGGYLDDRLSEQIGAQRFGELVLAEHNQKFPGFTLGLGYGDPTLTVKAQTDEKTVKQILGNLGFQIASGAVDIASRVEGIRGRLNTNIGGDPAILISRPGCPLLTEGLSGGYRYNVDATGKRILGGEPQKNEFSHLVDALGYIASKLFRPTGTTLGKYEPKFPRSPMAA